MMLAEMADSDSPNFFVGDKSLHHSPLSGTAFYGKIVTVGGEWEMHQKEVYVIKI